MDFLEDDYEEPKSAGHYMRFSDGDNRIRILSKPIVGLEEWIDEKPNRYPKSQRPDLWKDPSFEGKRFWAFIVWNYRDERIQILQLTQATIRKEIKNLTDTVEWGSPYGYDIQINKSGEKLKTKYSVNAIPHTPVSEEIRDAFVNTPCRLEALFEGEDPFAEWPNPTPMATVNTSSTSSSITQAQHEEIVALIGDDAEYMDRVTGGLKITYSIEQLGDLPSHAFEKVLNQVKLHAQERLAKELDDSLPF